MPSAGADSSGDDWILMCLQMCSQGDRKWKSFAFFCDISHNLIEKLSTVEESQEKVVHPVLC